MRHIVRAVAACVFASHIAVSTHAASVIVPAADSGFVTASGGSAKGDSFLAPSAKYNYSVGYEVHYSGGFYSSPPFSPMIRKNYFVFHLGGVDAPIAAATLKLWTGILESADPFETYVLKDTPDQTGALGDIGTLATSPMTSFDGPGDFGVAVASSLYSKLAAGTTTLASIDVTHAVDSSFLTMSFTSAGVAHLNALRLTGSPIVLGGLVATVDTVGGTTPQQQFGFTGPEIPAGDPKTPTLLVTTVPEPAGYLLMLASLALMGCIRIGRRKKPEPLVRRFS